MIICRVVYRKLSRLCGEAPIQITSSPEWFQSIIDNGLDGNRRDQGRLKPLCYIPVPCNNDLFHRVDKMVKKVGLNYILSPRSTLRNGRFIFSNVKDKKEITNARHGLFSVKCANCNFEKFFKTTNLNVGRTLMHHFNRRDSEIVAHMMHNRGQFSIYERFHLAVIWNRHLSYRRFYELTVCV